MAEKLNDGYSILEEYDNLTTKMLDLGYLTDEEDNVRMGVIEKELIHGIMVVNKLKSKLESFDMEREHGRLPANYSIFVDEIAKIVWNHKESEKK